VSTLRGDIMRDDQRFWTGGRPAVTRRQLLRGAGVAGLGLAAAALIGCGDDDDDGGAAAPAATTAPTAVAATAAAADQPVVSESFQILQSRDAASLDPLASQIYTTPERIGLVYPRLVSVIRNPGDDLADTSQVPSWAVDSWEFSPDGATLTFHMREGVKYSNTPPVNGRELVADDVKYSIERYKSDPTSVFGPRFSDVNTIDAVDDYTATFNLFAPSAYLMYSLSAEPAFITPREVGETEGDFKTTLVGPGPFLHDETIQGEGSRYTKNPDFIDADKIYYEKYDIKVVNDTATRKAALRTNEVDYSPSTNLNQADLATLDDKVVTFQNPPTSNFAVWFNMRNPKWADVRARRAIGKTIDHQQIIDQTMQGNGHFNGVIPIGFGKWAFQPDELKEFDIFQTDPAEAAKLWSAAGMPSTLNETYIAPSAVIPWSSELAELIGQQIEGALGLPSEYSTDEYSTFVNKVYNNKFEDVAIFGMGLYDPLDYLLAQYFPGGPRNGPGLNDPKVEADLTEMRQTLDEEERLEKVRALQTHILTNVLSMLHLPRSYSWAMYSSKLRNFRPALRPPGIEWTLDSWRVA
jgi:peptide/nickel transport system substrate-binding protein